jgi:hypothetical protein
MMAHMLSVETDPVEVLFTPFLLSNVQMGCEQNAANPIKIFTTREQKVTNTCNQNLMTNSCVRQKSCVQASP